jgi:hypothetical protein
VAATLTELLVERTKEDEFQSLLSTLQAKGFPVSDWLPGSAARTTFEAFAYELADFSALLPSLSKGGFAVLAAELADPVWLDLIAEQFYDLERARATFTVQVCRFSCTTGLGPQTINDGFVVRAPATGNRYIYKGGAGQVVPDGGSVDVQMTAESAGAKYADGANTITETVSSLPGVTVNNPAGKFGGIETTGIAKRNVSNTGSGTVTPSAAGTPAATRFYTITIIAAGDVGAGTVRIKYEQAGVTTTLADITPIPASTAAVGDGVTITFNTGTGTDFVTGDIHTFQTPGTPIQTAGTDDETNAALLSRLLGRWPSLSLNVVADKYVAWIQQASIDNALGIAKITVRPSTTIAGQASILVATEAGAVAGGAVSTLQDYINARDGVVDAGEVISAAAQAVTLTGTVTVKASQMVAVKAAADDNWREYIQALPIGGDTSTGSPGVVRLSELVQALMDAGAIDYSGLQLNGAAANLALTNAQVATIAAGPSTALTWVTVA